MLAMPRRVGWCLRVNPFDVNAFIVPVPLALLVRGIAAGRSISVSPHGGPSKQACVKPGTAGLGVGVVVRVL